MVYQNQAGTTRSGAAAGCLPSADDRHIARRLNLAPAAVPDDIIA